MIILRYCVALCCILPGLVFCQGFSDEFNGSKNDQWEWLREDPSRWLLSGDGITIISQTGALSGPQFNNVKNILLQDSPGGQFFIETKLDFDPDSTFHNAGLIYRIDDDNFVRLSRGVYNDVQSVWLGWDIGGVYNNRSVPNVSVSSVYLRLIVSGNQYFAGYYSLDGVQWEFINRTDLALPGGKAQIGIQAANGDGVSVTRKQIAGKFDYFTVDTSVPVEAVDAMPDDINVVQVYPQPALRSEAVTIQGRFQSSLQLSFVVSDALGRQVYRSEQHFDNDREFRHQIPPNTLTSGQYYITVSSGQRSMTKSFMVFAR
jgi:regulation of enolase protein 1 (concanavalin A-like superfamily)